MFNSGGGGGGGHRRLHMHVTAFKCTLRSQDCFRSRR